MFFSVLLLSLHDTWKGINSRVPRLCIKVCHFAMDEGVSQLAQRAYDIADKYPDTDPTSPLSKSLKTELLISQVRLSLLRKDFGSAALYDSKLNLKKDLETGVIETKVLLAYCRTLFNSSLGMFNEKEYSNALTFAEKAFEYLDLVDNGNQIGRTIKENVLSLLITVCTESKIYSKANNFIDIYQQLSPQSPEPFVLLLHLMHVLEYETKEEEKTISKMLGIVPISPNYDLISSTILKFAERDPLGALRCIDYMIFNKLNDHDLLEKLFTTRIWLTTCKVSESQAEKVSAFFNSIERLFSKALSAKCSNSIVTLLWNRSTGFKKEKKFDIAVKWLEICLHRLIKNEITDKGKIQRNILRCYALMGNFEKVESLYYVMDEEVRSNPLSQFYLFQSRLYQKDFDTCQKLIEKIKNSNYSNRIDVLGVCTVEASESGNQGIALCSMAAIMSLLNLGVTEKKIENMMSTSDVLLIISAVRSTVKLLLNEYAADGEDKESLAQLVEIFRQSYIFANILKSDENGKPRFENLELEWFASNAYNLGLSCITNKQNREARELSDISIQFIELMNLENKQKLEEMDLWYLRGVLMYLYSTLQLAHSRETPVEVKGNFYNEIRTRSRQWRDKIDQVLNVDCLPDDVKDLWWTFKYEALAFSFELEASTNDMISAKATIAESAQLPLRYCLEFDKIIANSLIKRDLDPLMKSSILLILFDKYIDSREAINSKLFSQWTRHLLSNLVENDNTTWDRIIQQIQFKIHATFASDPFPIEEIQWLCTISWNRGVTFLLSGSSDEANKWCEYCIHLSQYVSDEAEKRYKRLFTEMMEEMNS